MKVRIGQLLVEAGVLSEEQCWSILYEQRRTGQPFGLICEQLYGVDPGLVEEAWARQYACITRTVDPTEEVFEPRAVSLVTRRQAWQFRVLPVRFDGEELMVASTQAHLLRALRFATRVIVAPTYLVVANPLALGEALCVHYPLPGMTAESVLGNGVDGLLTRRR
ncbi:MAG: GspE/PulE/PilB domain-containing protein [Planctomycetota bacterium]|jgi:hypothetical protein